MCRLLGLIANRDVDLAFSLKSGPQTLNDMSLKNEDGWGLGWYEDKKPVLFREPLCARDSPQFPNAVTEGLSRIFIAHVRKATSGARHINNCHPFKYKHWLFAHNGSVDRNQLRNLLDVQHRQAVQGETDSEIYFHWLMQNIENSGSVFEGVQEAISVVKKYDHTGLNFLLTDGKCIYAYRDCSKNYDYYSLFFLDRDPGSNGPECFRSKQVSSMLSSKSLRGERAILICSEKLTEEAWREIPLGYLLSVDEDMRNNLLEVV